MIRGPLEYVPPVEVEVVTKRKAIPLDENEGIYVRDIKTGKVRRGVEGGGWVGGIGDCSFSLGSCHMWSNVHVNA